MIEEIIAYVKTVCKKESYVKKKKDCSFKQSLVGSVGLEPMTFTMST